MTGQPPLSSPAARLGAALETWPRRTVRLEELWALWADVEPVSLTGRTPRADLAASIAELATAGLVRPSRVVDRDLQPALPKHLTLPEPAPSATATQLARATVWRPELAFAVRGGLTVAQVVALRQVNAWLRDYGAGSDVLPLRERSLQVFGHEKALERSLATAAFSAGKLTLEMLRTFRTHPPLAVTRVGDGPVVLVLENADSFHSVREVLRHDPGHVGHVGWGAGGAFEASVHSAAELPGAQLVRYAGDLDADGLRIAASAARNSATDGGLPVAPAVGLYRMMFEHGVPQPGQPKAVAARAAELSRWLEAEDLREGAEDLLARGCRIPQECVHAGRLAADLRWRQDL